MAEEPTLPVLPGPLKPIFGDARKRKTYAASALFSNSSDPAVFSSDDDPALDNYVHGRRKKRYVGTWFDQHPASSDSVDSAMGDDMTPPRKRPRQRQFRRQLDSGVWMPPQGGASTDTDDCMDLEPPTPKLALLPSSAPVPGPRYSPEEISAQNAIQNCIDNGVEEVDLRWVVPAYRFILGTDT